MLEVQYTSFWRGGQVFVDVKLKVTTFLGFWVFVLKNELIRNIALGKHLVYRHFYHGERGSGIAEPLSPSI